MATEQTPLEPDLREPHRHSREFKTLLWLGGWGGAAAIALTALAIASQTKTAGERLRQVFAINEPAHRADAAARDPARVKRAAFVGTSTRTHRRARPAGRPHCLLESSIDDMTGAIKRQAPPRLPLSLQRPHRRPRAHLRRLALAAACFRSFRLPTRL